MIFTQNYRVCHYYTGNPLPCPIASQPGTCRRLRNRLIRKFFKKLRSCPSLKGHSPERTLSRRTQILASGTLKHVILPTTKEHLFNKDRIVCQNGCPFSPVTSFWKKSRNRLKFTNHLGNHSPFHAVRSRPLIQYSCILHYSKVCAYITGFACRCC